MTTPYKTFINTATIANGATTSDAVDMVGLVLCGISFPATFTGASVSFQVSNDGTTFRDYYNPSGQLVNIVVVAGKTIGINPTDFAGQRFLKVVSNAAESGARSIELIGRGL